MRATCAASATARRPPSRRFDACQGRGGGGWLNSVMEEGEVRAALASVEDPEAGMNIVDLGLVYSITAEPRRVRVSMTMTSPACPVAPYLVDEATAAIRAVAPEGTDVEVELVWEPPWTPELMSDEAKGRFGWQ